MILSKPLIVSLLLFLAQAPTPDIHYVPTSNGVADAMLKLANVTPSDTVYDLGIRRWPDRDRGGEEIRRARSGGRARRRSREDRAEERAGCGRRRSRDLSAA